jgi:hypothetical protein
MNDLRQLHLWKVALLKNSNTTSNTHVLVAEDRFI